MVVSTRHIIILTLLSYFCLDLMGQYCDLQILSKTDDAFLLFINGEQKTKSFSTNTEIKKLKSGDYTIRIVFENPYYFELTTVAQLKSGFSYSYFITKYNNGNFGLNQTQVKINQPNKTTINIKELIDYSLKTDSMLNYEYKQNNQKTKNNRISNSSPCLTPIKQIEFETFKATLIEEQFESNKLTQAKQLLYNNCLTSSQIKSILQIFTFESTRIEYAKLAYSNVFDKNNYSIVNDAFQFSSSIDELNRYIKQQK